MSPGQNPLSTQRRAGVGGSVGRGWGDENVPLKSYLVPPRFLAAGWVPASKPASAGKPPGQRTAGVEGCAERMGTQLKPGSIELRPLIFAGPRSFRARVAFCLTLPGGQEAEETLGGPFRVISGS